MPAWIEFERYYGKKVAIRADQIAAYRGDGPSTYIYQIGRESPISTSEEFDKVDAKIREAAKHA